MKTRYSFNECSFVSATPQATFNSTFGFTAVDFLVIKNCSVDLTSSKQVLRVSECETLRLESCDLINTLVMLVNTTTRNILHSILDNRFTIDTNGLVFSQYTDIVSTQRLDEATGTVRVIGNTFNST